MGKEFDTIFFVIYLLVGGYFINMGISYMTIPKIVTSYDKWIMLIGGILIVLGGVSHLRLGFHKRKAREYRAAHR